MQVSFIEKIQVVLRMEEGILTHIIESRIRIVTLDFKYCFKFVFFSNNFLTNKNNFSCSI